MEEIRTEKNFIEEIVESDLKSGYYKEVHTRFPPEPNGYLHIGHLKAVHINYKIKERFNGKFNLRFDDTNPETESKEYVEAIKEDLIWLGYKWDKECYASDYFDTLYEWAKVLIKKGLAYVCDLSAEEVANMRGTPTIPATPSPYRNRSVEENLELFERMRNGEFPDGSKTLRAKIDLASPNMHLRDPVLYRIKKVPHHRAGNKWPIYPTYDFAHGQSDYIEGITHSICTLEFEIHRPLYEWLLEAIGLPHPRPKQIEFSRLNLSHTVMSKRKLLKLVEEKYVNGWDDPRLPTIRGLRRRGYTPEALKKFVEIIGVSKRENVIRIELLEHCIREDLNKKAFRIMCVIDPLKVVITNVPDDFEEEIEAINNPEDLSMGTRKIKFTKEFYVERSDFLENPPKDFYRLYPGNEVRLRYAYIFKCEEVIKDEKGSVVELRGTIDLDTKGGKNPKGKKIKSTIHWVSCKYNLECEVRIYDKLFLSEVPDEKENFLEDINPNSLVIKKAFAEEYVKNVKPFEHYQFERIGYFVVDPDTTENKIVFNKTVSLKDDYAKKIEKYFK